MKRTIVLVLLTCVGWGVSACGGGPSEAKCKAAIQKQWDGFLADPTNTAGKVNTRPAACDGLSNQVINRLATEVMSTPAAT